MVIQNGLESLHVARFVTLGSQTHPGNLFKYKILIAKIYVIELPFR